MRGSNHRLQARLTLTILLLIFSLLGDFLSLPMLYGMKFHFSTLFIIMIYTYRKPGGNSNSISYCLQ